MYLHQASQEHLEYDSGLEFAGYRQSLDTLIPRVFVQAIMATEQYSENKVIRKKRASAKTDVSS